MFQSVAIIVILINFVITLAGWYGPRSITEQGMLRPYFTFRENRWYQLITSGFLHGDWTHLLFNMITLFFFGPSLEGIIGPQYFLWLYFTSIVIANIPSLFRQRNNINYASLGASGGVNAVLFSYILFFPFNKIYIFFIPIGIPAIIFAFLFLWYSIYSSKKQTDNINHDAHLAGAGFGVLFTITLIPGALEHFLTVLGLL